MFVLRRVFLVASLTWAAALPLSTLAASLPRPMTPAFGFAFVVYAIGGLVCHQRPERSFWLWGTQMPVCARCSGIYVGAALAAALALVLPGRGVRPWHGELPRLGERRLIWSAAVPTVVTLAAEWTTIWIPGNAARALAGLPLGAVIAWIVVSEWGAPGGRNVN